MAGTQGSGAQSSEWVSGNRLRDIDSKPSPTFALALTATIRFWNDHLHTEVVAKRR